MDFNKLANMPRGGASRAMADLVSKADDGSTSKPSAGANAAAAKVEATRKRAEATYENGGNPPAKTNGGDK